MPTWKIVQGDVREGLRTLPPASVQTCVTSPPYYALRDYGEERQIGLEDSPMDYIAALVETFEEVKRVLKDDGTLWLNLGDCFAGSGKGVGRGKIQKQAKAWQEPNDVPGNSSGWKNLGIKPKDLVGIPWMVAFALRAAGWYLRSDIIWCLSGGAYVYARTQRGVMPIMVRELMRLEPSTVELWNGEKWTRLLGVSKSPRKGDELEILLRSGERISCTPTHRFPTQRGLLSAGALVAGDILQRCELPDDGEEPLHIGHDAAWLAGLYIAEGSRSGGTIQIAGHAKEDDRWWRVKRIAESYGGSATRTVTGNCMNIRIYGKILNAIIDHLVGGKVAKNKHFANACWRYGNNFIRWMLIGYLSGDGHWDEKNGRWRLGFTRNYDLERDLRTVCARLGYHLVLNTSTVAYKGGSKPIFRGEIRTNRSGYHNECDTGEIVEIRRARCREVYDLGVEDEPHLFALSSGILTHNSKPNPMPESVRDRPTRAHEFIFLMSKSARYYYDYEAVRQPLKVPAAAGIKFGGIKHAGHIGNPNYSGHEYNAADLDGANLRDVWSISTRSYDTAHFATFPPDLIRPCIMAGAPADFTVLDPFCGSGTTGVVALRCGRSFVGVELSESYVQMARERIQQDAPLFNVPAEEGYDYRANALALPF